MPSNLMKCHSRRSTCLQIEDEKNEWVDNKDAANGDSIEDPIDGCWGEVSMNQVQTFIFKHKNVLNIFLHDTDFSHVYLLPKMLNLFQPFPFIASIVLKNEGWFTSKYVPIHFSWKDQEYIWGRVQLCFERLNFKILTKTSVKYSVFFP